CFLGQRPVRVSAWEVSIIMSLTGKNLSLAVNRRFCLLSCSHLRFLGSGKSPTC
ncbi:hypothetical protein AVDCRST_MAG84-7713, partial [uncultured Microcoleus sp.]